MPIKPEMTTKRTSNHTVVVLVCAGLVSGMAGLTYASVPLYKLFCQVTGYGGTTQVADDVLGPMSEKTITVRFDANIANNFGWKFAPKQRSITLHLGEKKTAYYTAHNPSSKTTWGTSTFNVSPQIAGQYFNKIECFCFTEQKLKAGESVEMPVVFFVDPDILNEPLLKDNNTITLSYTFFPTDAPEKPVAAVTEEKMDSETETKNKL